MALRTTTASMPTPTRTGKTTKIPISSLTERSAISLPGFVHDAPGMTSPPTCAAERPAQQPVHAGRTAELGEPSVAWPVCCSAWFGGLCALALLDPFEILLNVPDLRVRRGSS